MKKPRVYKKKLSPLDKMLEYHKQSCAFHVHSGDRHCSCGREEAIAEVARLREIEKKCGGSF